jgi:uncharacterized protein YegP (UPF0339 family)
MYRFVVFQGSNRQWYWHLIAPNNQRIAASGEGFVSQSGATQSAQLVKRVAGSASGP